MHNIRDSALLDFTRNLWVAIKSSYLAANKMSERATGSCWGSLALLLVSACVFGVGLSWAGLGLLGGWWIFFMAFEVCFGCVNFVTNCTAVF